MADPFEVRMRFTAQLQHLNASVTSSQKAAQYAIKYKDMDEDLHSCILEQLEKNSMNNRANIMYFLEHLCDMASRESHPDYIRMMQRDILRIVDAVAPEDGSGAANVKVVRKVLSGLQSKTHLLAQTVTEIEECLKERDTLPEHVGLSSPVRKGTTATGDAKMGGMIDSHGVAEQSQSRGEKGLSGSSSSKQGIAASQLRLDKKQIEQRIEEDRERHKRSREHQWAIPFDEDEDAEFEQMFDETSSLGSDDYRVFEEEAMQREECSREHMEEMEINFGDQARMEEKTAQDAPEATAAKNGES